MQQRAVFLLLCLPFSSSVSSYSLLPGCQKSSPILNGEHKANFNKLVFGSCCVLGAELCVWLGILTEEGVLFPSKVLS